MSTAESQRLREDLGDLYRLPVPAMTFEPVAAARSNVVERVQRRWRPALALGAAAAALALFVAGPAMLGGSTPEVSAEQLLERTKAFTAAAPLSVELDAYHLVSTSSTPNGGSMTTEVWSDGAGRQRSETRDAATGELINGFITDGENMWFYAEVDGQLKAVHSTLAGGSFSVAFGAQVGFGAGSLADLLETFTSDCSDARSLGEETVAGRKAYVIEVTPTPETCDMQFRPVAGGEGGIAVSGTKVEGDGEAGEPAFSIAVGGPMKMWIDQETFMTLKSESSFDGNVFGYEVTTLDLDPAFVDGQFDVPDGATVVESGSPEAEGVGFRTFSVEVDGEHVKVEGGGAGFGAGTFEMRSLP